MTFVDTSAMYAWVDRTDPNHAAAVRRLHALLDAGEELVTHTYVLVESMVLVQARLGVKAAARLANDAREFVITWVDPRSRSIRTSFPPASGSSARSCGRPGWRPPGPAACGNCGLERIDV